MPLKTIFNIVLYQCAWFACVLGAAHQQPWMGLGVTGVVLAWHFMQVEQVKPEAWLILIALLIGLLFDQALLSFQLIDYRAHGWSEAFVPAWILALWLGFATLLNVSLRWMRTKLVIAALFGFIGGPLAYYAAVGLDAITITNYTAYGVLAIGWAIVTPLLLVVAKRFDGFSLPMKEANI